MFFSVRWRGGVLSIGMLGLLLCGCGSKHGAEVSGLVTLDGKPLTLGNVSFQLANGPGAVAYGAIDSNGRYVLSTGTDAGLAPGKYLVTVLATKPVTLTGPVAYDVIPEPNTPERYATTETSGLSFEVKAGKNDIPLVLTTNP
jgi:hypothetical protein